MIKSGETRRLLAAAAATVAVVFLVLNASGSTPFVLLWICLNITLAMSLRLVMLVGEINLAMGAFYGIGAYSAAKLSLAGLHFIAAVLIGAVVAAVAAALFGSVALRVSGASFLLVSFAFNEVLRLLYTKSDFLGGNSGLVGITASTIPLAITIVVFSGAVVYLSWLMERSKWGLYFAAVQHKPSLASAIGIEPSRVKLVAIVISALVTGAAGGLFAHYSSVVAPQDFSFMISITVLAYVMIGGRSHTLGPVIGAAVLTFVSQELQGVGAYEPLVYGVALMVAMVFAPRGLAGLAEAFWTRVRPKGNWTDRPDRSGAPEEATVS